jgi:ribosomal protein S28E/S33
MIKAKQPNTLELRQSTPLPEGTYTVQIVELGEWQSKVKAVGMINAKDSKGNLLRDDNNGIVKDQVKNYEFFTLEIKMKVVEGEHEGRTIYGSLTTHDNVLFLTENFLYAMGISELNNINDLFKHNLVGKRLKVETQNQTYTKAVMNNDTGMSTDVEKIKIRIKKYLKAPISKDNA